MKLTTNDMEWIDPVTKLNRRLIFDLLPQSKIDPLYFSLYIVNGEEIHIRIFYDKKPDLEDFVFTDGRFANYLIGRFKGEMDHYIEKALYDLRDAYKIEVLEKVTTEWLMWYLM